MPDILLVDFNKLYIYIYIYNYNTIMYSIIT